MRSLNVLVACECSQVICLAFRRLGHNSFSCDIVPCLGGCPEFHILDDCLKVINGHCSFITCDGTSHVISGSWDLVIAHPPCTYLTNCGARLMYPSAGNLDADRYSKALLAKDFFLKCLNCDSPHVCVENPLPLKCIGLPHPNDCIQPYFFGDPYSKRTLLWLKDLPCLLSTCLCSSFTNWVVSSTHAGVAKSRYERSKSFSGIAAAMADQYSRYILSL